MSQNRFSREAYMLRWGPEPHEVMDVDEIATRPQTFLRRLSEIKPSLTYQEAGWLMCQIRYTEVTGPLLWSALQRVVEGRWLPDNIGLPRPESGRELTTGVTDDFKHWLKIHRPEIFALVETRRLDVVTVRGDNQRIAITIPGTTSRESQQFDVHCNSDVGVIVLDI